MEIPTIGARKIKRATILIYVTVLLAAGQSILLHLGTSCNGHEVFSTYFMVEVLILALTVAVGLKNKWTRMIFVLLLSWETIIFFKDMPISPDGLLMIFIWGIRVYVVAVLFSGTMNQFCRSDPSTRKLT
jgi:hypothetical protein